MPQGTANLTPTGQIPLSSCEGAWVVLRKMTYGERQARAGLVSQMHTDLKQDGQAPRKLSFDMDLMDGRAFDFTKCVVDHNLEDDSGRKLNFANRADLVALDPAIGEEIGDLIDKLNAGEDLGSFLSPSVGRDIEEQVSSA